MRTATKKQGRRSPQVKLRPGRTGFTIVATGEEIDGFPDLRRLPKAARLQVARWAKQLTPAQLSPEQQQLLDEAGPRQPSETHLQRWQQGERLGDPVTRLMWDVLTPAQRALVLSPQKKIPGSDYPLTTPELAELVDLEPHRIRQWADSGLLPHYRRGRVRYFDAAAVTLALALHDSPQADRQFYSDLVADDEEGVAKRIAAVAALATLKRSSERHAEEMDGVLEQSIALLTSATKLLEARRTNDTAKSGPKESTTGNSAKVARRARSVRNKAVHTSGRATSG